MDRRSGGPGRGFEAQLGQRRWQALCDAGTDRSYRPGQFLLRQGDRGGFVLALTSGRVRVSALEQDGTQLLQALRGPGDLIGEMAMRSGAERTAAAVALDRCTARCLPVDTFQRFLDLTGAQGALSDYLIAKLSETVPYQLQLVHFTPRQRIARLLLKVIALAGSLPEPMRIPFSQTGIATALGLARSTVAEQIAVLRDAGALAPGPSLVVIDPRLLRQAAGIGGGSMEI
jgi:CRP/FNR family transcriptional regulator, cyclic AMP receptor protein